MYKRRMLRRLYIVKVFDEDPDENPDSDTHEEKVIAWNETDAIRRCGPFRVAERPQAECYVTWDDQPKKIYDSKKGPSEEPADPTLGAVTEDDFTEGLSTKKKAKKK